MYTKLLKWVVLTVLPLFVATPVVAGGDTEPALMVIQLETLSDDQIGIDLQTSLPVALPKTFSTDQPARIVLDYPGLINGLDKAASKMVYQIGVVEKITVIEAGQKTRVVIELHESVPYDIQATGNSHRLTLKGKATRKVSSYEPFHETAASNNQYTIKGIDFRRGAQGEGKVIIDLSSKKAPIDFSEEGEWLQVRFMGAAIDHALLRNLDVIDFGTPVLSIMTTKVDNDVVIRMKVNGLAEHIAYQADKQFTIEVRAQSQSQKQQRERENQTYSGERLSLNFQDIEVRAVLQLIADFTGLNIVTSDTVAGNLTLRLRNVPWDQALDIILRTKGLAKRQVGNVVLIGPSEEIAAREKLELQASKEVQELAPLRSEFVQVNYAKAQEIAALLKAEENSLLSARGNVAVDERTNTLLVQDTAKKLEEIRSLVRRLDVPIRQVLIEARVVYANDDFDTALGVNFGASIKATPGKEPVIGVAGNLTGSNAIVAGGVADQLSRQFVKLLPAQLLSKDTIASGVGLTIGSLPGGTILDLELAAMEKEGLGKIVASPRLITSNQQTAYIESGEEIPYQEASSSGAATISFKKAVLRLEVTPQITPDDYIIMELTVNQDTKGDEINNVPAINTRELHTRVLVKNGETVVLGGIYQQQKITEKSRVPFFADIPGLGWLFKNEREQDRRNELMIFVTPKIIQEGVS